MTERLKRFTSDADMHKVLDVAYISAFAIGIVQVALALIVVESGNATLGTQLLLLQMATFALAGGAAYIFHIKGEVFWEAGMIPAVVIGMAIVIVGHTMANLAQIQVAEPFYVTMAGLALGIGVWFEVEMVGRFYKILARRRQIKISQRARSAVEAPISVAAVQNRINGTPTTL